MSSAGVSDTSSLERMIRQDRLFVAFGLLAVIALSWIYLVTESAGMRSMLSQAEMQGLAPVQLQLTVKKKGARRAPFFVCTADQSKQRKPPEARAESYRHEDSGCTP